MNVLQNAKAILLNIHRFVKENFYANANHYQMIKFVELIIELIEMNVNYNVIECKCKPKESVLNVQIKMNFFVLLH